MKEIKETYSLKSMLMVTIMMICCTLIMIFQKWLPLYIFCGVLNCVGFKCWFDFVSNIVIKPKEEILYLSNKNGNKYTFINSKGKIFFVTKQKDYEVNKFYLVLKTKDYIIKIIKNSNNDFKIPEIKESYWANWYYPNGNLRGLLPIGYLILIIDLAVIFSSTNINFSWIIMLFLTVYLIIYDLIYKIKKKKSIDGEVDNSKLLNLFGIFINGIKLVTIFIICIILFILFISIKSIAGKLLLLPFLLCAICVFFKTISEFIGNYKLVVIFDKLYKLIFLIYWFGFVGIGLYSAIINKEDGMILFIIPFIIAGIIVVKKERR